MRTNQRLLHRDLENLISYLVRNMCLLFCQKHQAIQKILGHKVLHLTLTSRPLKPKHFIFGLNYTINQSLANFPQMGYKILC